jgi:probable HAF family extracellular repeat protein
MNNGINRREEIVGFYVDPSTGIRHSYLLRKGVATPIDFPSANATLAWDINNRRQVVGWYRKNDGVVHGFIWHKGKFTSVDIPGAVETVVFGINSAGERKVTVALNERHITGGWEAFFKPLVPHCSRHYV